MKYKASSLHYQTKFFSHGLALIELMIALVLGLVIAGAAAGIMLSNTESFRVTRGLSQVQDSARVGFELMARDLRQAGSVPCGNDIAIDNILVAGQPGTAPWQYDWDAGAQAVVGYPGATSVSSLDNRISGTQAITLLSFDNLGATVTSFAGAGGPHVYTYDAPGQDFQDDDVVLVCDATSGALFQADVDVDSGQIRANSAANTSTSPGIYEKNSVIGKLSSRAWYIGDNGRAEEGGRSLYMAVLGAGSISRIEIAAGIADMRLRYRLGDTSDFVEASAVGAQWDRVNAVEVTLDLLSQDQNISTDASVDSGRLGRSFTGIVALRNRTL